MCHKIHCLNTVFVSRIDLKCLLNVVLHPYPAAIYLKRCKAIHASCWKLYQFVVTDVEITQAHQTILWHCFDMVVGHIEVIEQYKLGQQLRRHFLNVIPRQIEMLQPG
jgi:hypothetical protein